MHFDSPCKRLQSNSEQKVASTVEVLFVIQMGKRALPGDNQLIQVREPAKRYPSDCTLVLEQHKPPLVASDLPLRSSHRV